jgi:hypothetical protein
MDAFLDEALDAGQKTTILSGIGALPLAGGIMDSGADIIFTNSSAIREAGAQGLEIECSVGYRWQWVAGRMILRQINSGQIARILAIDNINPSATDDITEGFVSGTRWETVDGTIYTCTDATTDAAVWEVIPIGGSGFTNVAGTGPANFPHGLTAQENTTLAGITETVVAIGNSGTTQTLNISAETFQTVTLTGNCTFTMPTATAGKSFTLKVMTGAGGFAATFTGVKWSDNIVPIITNTAGRYDLISFIADGTAWSGSAIQNFTP